MSKDKKNYLIIISVILVIILCITHFTNEFGSYTDWMNQHTLFPDYFRKMFYATGKILPNFSLNYGGGQNIFNLSYYGLLNPFVLLSYLFPFINMTLFLTIINILIVILSGILFYKWLRRNEYNERISLLSTLILICSQSFIFHMHRHIMFVNYMPFVILGLMGVDNLLKDNKKTLLIVSIFLMIMTSYYYSIGGILALASYYLYKYFDLNKDIEIKKIFKNIIKTITYVLISIGLASILLLPTAYTLLNGRAASTNNSSLLSLLIPSLKIHKVFCGTYAIGVSMLGFVSLLYLFYTKKKKNVILGTVVSIILFIPIFCYLLNGGLYLREKCFIPFTPLISFMCAIFLNDLFTNKIEIKKFLKYVILINIPIYFFNQKQWCYLYLLGIIIALFIYEKRRNKKILEYTIAISVFSICLITNFFENYISIADYHNKYFISDINTSINKINKEDNEFYRTNNLVSTFETSNKIYNTSYYTTNIYSSTYNYDYLEFVRKVFKINVPDDNYFYVSSSSNNLFNRYMGVKYIYSYYNPGLGYRKIANNLYKNDNVYPIIYATSNTLSEEKFDNLEYPYNIETLFKNVIVKNSDNVNLDNHIYKENITYKIISKDDNINIENISNNQYIINVNDKTGYMKIKLDKKLENKVLFITLKGLSKNSKKNGNIGISINNNKNLLTSEGWIYPNYNNDFHYVITADEIEYLNVELMRGKYTIDDIEIYIIDNEYLDKPEIDEFNLTEFKDDTIKGNISITNDGYLTTTIPYDKGFTIKVNGRVVEYEKVNKAFIGLPITKGDKEIEISYKSPLLKEGKIISIISLIPFAYMVITDYKKKK